MSYTSYQNQVSSEKLTLAIVHASKRLIAWSLHSGSIYKLENFDIQSIVSIEDSGNAYTEVDSLAEVTASKFYHDRENKVLYLRTTGSDNPNGRFLVLTFKLFFSNAPIVLPHDLENGYEVYFEPTLKSTSAFGVEIDTINQTSEAIEGSGSLTLLNDTDFWRANYDKLTFENKPCFIYSHNRELDPSEAKLIFRGLIETKSYSKSQVQFSLRDQLSVLRDPVPLANIEDLGERTSEGMARAKQRMVLGRVYGHRLTNLDEVLDGYPITGTVSISFGSNELTGVSTQFLAELSPNDRLILNGEEYTIATVDTNTLVKLTENYTGNVNLSGTSVTVKPEEPKRYMNRRWLVAGHALRQPTATIQNGSTITRLQVNTTRDIREGDYVYVGDLGSGERAQVGSVYGDTLLELTTSLQTIPPPGTSLFRPAVQNVRIDDVLLVYDQDYSFDASTGILELSVDAEKNSAPLKQMANELTFTDDSRIITGTNLSNLLKPGYVVGAVGNADMFEVLSVDSDTQATLRVPATFSSSTTKGLYKSFILDPENSVVTCDVLGRTADGTPEGALLDSAPKIVKALLEDMGLENSIHYNSFQRAEETAYQSVGLVIPNNYDEDTTPTYRDVMNRINPSVFGSLIQTSEFLLSYLVLQPEKAVLAKRLDETDVIGDISVENNSDKIVKTAIVSYRRVEYDYLTKDELIKTKQKTSENGTYLIRTNRERTFDTVLVDERDAEIYAARWALLLQNSSTSIKFKTKLQGMALDVGSIVDLSHRKLYERFGANNSRKLGLVESVRKTGRDVELVIVDISNTFNRVAAINDLETIWSETDEDGQLYGGFITDDYGLIDNSESSFGTNLIY